MALETMIPPTVEGKNKFILVESQGKKCIRFSPKYHLIILENFLKEEGIPFDWDAGEKPAVEGDSYRMYGAGKVIIHLNDKRAVFDGASGSADYEITFYRDQITELQKLVPDWKFELI